MSENGKAVNSSQNAGISSQSYRVISLLVMGTLIVVIFVGNSLAIAAYSKANRFRVVTRCFIVNLAVTDLLVGTVIMPLWFHYMLQEQISVNTLLYKIWVTLDIACATASTASLAVVSLDRYLIISEPLSYEGLLPKKGAAFIIILVWLYAFGVAMLRILNWYYYSMLVTGLAFVLPLCIMLFAYVNIFRVAKTQAYRIRLSSLSNPTESRLKKKRFDKELKATKTISLVIGAFLLCWLPFLTVNLLTTYCTNKCNISFEFLIAVKWLHYANSGLNPIIYALHSRDFRATLRAICCGQGSNVESRTGNSMAYVISRGVSQEIRDAGGCTCTAV